MNGTSSVCYPSVIPEDAESGYVESLRDDKQSLKPVVSLKCITICTNNKRTDNTGKDGSHYDTKRAQRDKMIRGLKGRRRGAEGLRGPNRIVASSQGNPKAGEQAESFVLHGFF